MNEQQKLQEAKRVGKLQEKRRAKEAEQRRIRDAVANDSEYKQVMTELKESMLSNNVERVLSLAKELSSKRSWFIAGMSGPNSPAIWISAASTNPELLERMNAWWAANAPKR